MRFLNIFPIKLRVEKNSAGQFVGTLFFNLDQYGLVFSEQQCPVRLHTDEGVCRIEFGSMGDLEAKHLEKFAQALNHYVTGVLRFNPEKLEANVNGLVKEIYFGDVFFDLSSEDKHFKNVINPA